MEEHRGEVVADFQEYYSVALPLDGEPGDLERAAVLWQHLPADSRTAKRQLPELQWGVGEYLMWQIEFHVRELIWVLTNSKKKPLPKPQPLSSPGKMAEARRKRDSALAAREEINKKLGLEGIK